MIKPKARRSSPWNWDKVVQDVMNWYVHDDGPYPPLWAKADPWQSMLKELGVL